MENRTPTHTANIFFGQTRAADQRRLRKRIKPTAKAGHNPGLIKEVDGGMYAGGVPPTEVQFQLEQLRNATPKVTKAAKPYQFRGKGYANLKELCKAARKGKVGQFTAKYTRNGTTKLVTIKVIGAFVAIKREGCAWENAPM